jgi:nucleoside-diphosphate-sugar epimerase
VTPRARRTGFITGATGFLGLNVVDALLAKGWRVVALHRARTNVSRLQERGVSLAEGALDDRMSLERAIPWSVPDPRGRARPGSGCHDGALHATLGG